ncbi:hypothetical protein B0H19DRAFT_1263718 [Mycena capillaripes]|nr:hypothetical protein B0H19DRAFT_1263718 [Mycena capillaripes]
MTLLDVVEADSRMNVPPPPSPAPRVISAAPLPLRLRGSHSEKIATVLQLLRGVCLSSADFLMEILVNNQYNYHPVLLCLVNFTTYGYHFFDLAPFSGLRILSTEAGGHGWTRAAMDWLSRVVRRSPHLEVLRCLSSDNCP